MASPVKIKAVVKEVIKHTDSVASCWFSPQGRVPKFRAGQFLHVALDEYQTNLQWPDSRIFSIASSPSERCNELAVTFSVKGKFTERMYQTLEAGLECWLKLPYGEFLFPAGKHLTLIAGGVGITPYLSLLKQMLEEKSEQPTSLYYGVRSADDYLFAGLLERCEAELPNFSKTVYCENGSMLGENGILDINAIHTTTPDDSLFYISGPPAMIVAFKQQLLELGVDGEHIVVDDWE